MRWVALAALLVAACHNEPPPQQKPADDLKIEKLPPTAATPAPMPVAAPIEHEPYRGTCGDHSTGNPAPPVACAKAGIGKVTIVYFWATWCGPCQQDFKAYQKLYAEKHDRGLDFYAISVDDERSGLADFAKQYGATFPIAWDNAHKDAECWHIGTMPTTFVMDARGIIRFIHEGSHAGEAEKIAEEIDTLL